MDKRFEFKKAEREGLMTDALIIVDKETGVNYLFVRSGYGAGLTPLIDAEGKPIVTKERF
jgi:hypothetical protein